MSGWAAAAGAAVQGVTGIVGGAMSNHAQKQANRENLNFQREMWNKQNEYNTPLNQRKRLEAGGLNPNLVYGNGSVSNTADSAGTPNVRPLDGFEQMAQGVSGGISTYFNTKLQQAQYDNLQKDIDYKNAQIFATYMAGGKSAQDTESGAWQTWKDKDLFSISKDAAVASVEKIKRENEGLKITNDNMDTTQKATIDNIRASTANLKSSSSATDVRKAIDEVKLILNRAGIDWQDNVVLRQVLLNPNARKDATNVKQAIEKGVKTLGDAVEETNKYNPVYSMGKGLWKRYSKKR